MDMDMVSPCAPWAQFATDTEKQAELAQTIFEATQIAVNQATSRAMAIMQAAQRQCRKLLDSNIKAKQESLLVHVFTVWHCASQLAELDKQWTEVWAANDKQKNADIVQRESEHELGIAKLELALRDSQNACRYHVEMREKERQKELWDISKEYRISEVTTMKQNFEDALKAEKEKRRMANAEIEALRCALQEEQKTKQERQVYRQKTDKLLGKIDLLTNCDFLSPKPPKVKNHTTDWVLHQLHLLLADLDPRYLVRSNLPRVAENSPPWSHSCSDRDAHSICTLSPNSTPLPLPPYGASPHVPLFRAQSVHDPSSSGVTSPPWVSYNVRSSPHIGLPRTLHIPNALRSLPPSEALLVHSPQQVPPHLRAQLSPRCPHPPLASQAPKLSVQALPFGRHAPTLGCWAQQQASSGIPLNVTAFTQAHAHNVVRNGTSTTTSVVPPATLMGGDTSPRSRGVASTVCLPTQNPRSFPILLLSPSMRTGQLFHSPRQR
eukprot:GEMP01009672.1.p1 GENE.GEMP01009672.1~~GEMP01009672.1.p1  ORF type:complete len:493 (+),score=110.31 GEMP01009672.1:123-1601(+)